MRTTNIRLLTSYQLICIILIDMIKGVKCNVFDALESMTADMQLSDDFVVDDLLSSIPKKNSAIIKMKVLDGISFVQIAKELGEPVVKIRQCYNEGIDMLRQNI